MIAAKLSREELSHWKAHEAMPKGVVGSGSSPLLDQSSRCFLKTRSSIFSASALLHCSTVEAVQVPLILKT